MSQEPVERRLAAILSADVAGYTRLIAADEDGTIRRLEMIRELVEERVGEHGGRLVDFTGDNFLAEFSSAVSALSCAVDIQDGLAASHADEDAGRRMELRMGLDVGEVQARGGRIYGDAVNLAARLEAQADSGGICVSETLREQVGSKLPLVYDGLGPRELKNVDRPVRIFRVRRGDGLPREASPPAGVERPPSARKTAMVVVAAIAAALAIVSWWFLADGGGSASATAIESVAVLPLENLMNDPGQAYFVDGMTEALIAELARAGSLRVISRTSAMQFADSPKSLPEIAAELGVDAVVEGSVLRAGDDVRITAQLIDGRSDQHLWAGTYERSLEDVLRLQREVAAAIAREIRGTLNPAVTARLADTTALSKDAQEAYLWGRHHLNLRTAESLEAAQRYFQQAIDAEPEYAAAHAGLADTYLVLPAYGSMGALEASALTNAAALRALELDPSSAEGHKVLGYASFTYGWDWDLADRELARAVELNPSDAAAWQWRCVFLAAMGRFEEARADATRARELDPLAPIIVDAGGLVEMMADSYDAAIHIFEDVLSKTPGFVPSRENLGQALMAAGRLEEATEVLDELVRETGHPRSRALLARAHAAAGREDEGRSVLVGLTDADSGSVVALASAVYLLGDVEDAFRLLEEAFKERAPLMMALNVIPMMDPLRGEPRFQEILERLQFPESAR